MDMFALDSSVPWRVLTSNFVLCADVAPMDLAESAATPFCQPMLVVPDAHDVAPRAASGTMDSDTQAIKDEDLHMEHMHVPGIKEEDSLTGLLPPLGSSPIHGGSPDTGFDNAAAEFEDLFTGVNIHFDTCHSFLSAGFVVYLLFLVCVLMKCVVRVGLVVVRLCNLQGRTTSQRILWTSSIPPATKTSPCCHMTTCLLCLATFLLSRG